MLNAEANPYEDERIADTCALYRDSVTAINMISFLVNKMTEVIALESTGSDLAMGPLEPSARKLEYKRQGTQP